MDLISFSGGNFDNLIDKQFIGRFPSCTFLTIHLLHSKMIKKGSDLRELRLSWKEMENLIFERFIRILGDILGDFLRNFGDFF